MSGNLFKPWNKEKVFQRNRNSQTVKQKTNARNLVGKIWVLDWLNRRSFFNVTSTRIISFRWNSLHVMKQSSSFISRKKKNSLLLFWTILSSCTWSTREISSWQLMIWLTSLKTGKPVGGSEGQVFVTASEKYLVRNGIVWVFRHFNLTFWLPFWK